MKNKIINNESLPLSMLRQMEVIDISDGKRLGFMGDLVFNDDLTKIEAIIVPSSNNFLSMFRRKDDYYIKWSQIKTIGKDIIIVDLKENSKDDEIYDIDVE